jgi:hypothetical protein
MNKWIEYSTILWLVFEKSRLQSDEALPVTEWLFMIHRNKLGGFTEQIKLAI